jgi:hypothetical protein
VKNDYGTEKEAWALNGLEEPLKNTTYTRLTGSVQHIIPYHYELMLQQQSGYLNGRMLDRRQV